MYIYPFLYKYILINVSLVKIDFAEGISANTANAWEEILPMYRTLHYNNIFNANILNILALLMFLCTI